MAARPASRQCARPRLRQRAASESLERRLLLSLAAAGAELHVNTITSNDQRDPAIAVDGDGDFVVAWTSSGQEGTGGQGIFAQRFSAAGVAQGGELHVNMFTPFDQSAPTVAIDADGDFVVAWQDVAQEGTDAGIYAQRYDAAGNALGGNFHVNSFTTGGQLHPAVAMDAAGDFVIVWDSPQDGSNLGIVGKRYNFA